MSPTLPRLLLIASTVTTPLDTALSQSSPASPHRIQLIPSVGYFTFGTYFTGPAGVRFSNQDGLAYGGQVAVTLWRHLALVGSVLRGSSDWSFESVPLVGRISIGGAGLLLYDAGLRLGYPLGASSPVAAVGQVTAGAIRYSIDHPLLSGAATNFALSLGAGLSGRLTRTMSLHLLVKDYIASFRSVDEAASLGIEGQRAHTIGVLVAFGIGL
ncbi:MAG TPA: hypothetical protein VHH32_05470 [Gemmatimonadales bacterium]|nr:hypothetical protein [Gemmatimonadales bacterium]